jgi:hypothetical protein
MRANGDKRWLHLLPDVVSQYNRQFVTGTTIRRIDVNSENLPALLEQLHDTPEPTLAFTLGTTTSYPEPIEKLIFRYEIGDKVGYFFLFGGPEHSTEDPFLFVQVLLARRSDYTLSSLP